jgi:tRNA (adenine22-N1)-methyltransferase
MDKSKRIEFIVSNLEKVTTLADIGTDHGYVPLLALKNELCEKAIACDINKDPLAKGKLNAILEGIDDKIEFRLGNGFEPLKVNEVEEVVIAGMGGNLIRDIIEKDLNKVASCNYLVLIPAQNPEVLREYLYKNNFEIIKENLCFDEGIYYELFKVRKAEGNVTELDSIYYEISPMLLRSKHPLMKDYIDYKIDEYNRILGFIKDGSESAIKRKTEVSEKIEILNGMKNYL